MAPRAIPPSAPFLSKSRNPNGLRLFCLFWLRGIEAIYSTSIAAGDKMAVDVHGNLDALVAQLLFHVNWAFTLAQQKAGVSMPDVVNTHFPDACLGQDSLENPPDMILFNQLFIALEDVSERYTQSCPDGLSFSGSEQLF